MCAKQNTIRLNIGGTCFQTLTETLQTFPESKLANLTKYPNNFDDVNNEYFFDRNPVLFAFILDSYRKEEIHLPGDICGPTFRKELDYWGLLESHVAPCCWETLYRSEGDIQTVNQLLKNYTYNSTITDKMEHMKWRKKLWLLLEDPNSSKLAKAWVIMISMLVVVSTFVEMLLSLPEFSDEFSHTEKASIDLVLDMHDAFTNASIHRILTMKPNRYMYMIVAACHVGLTFELILSFIICPSKKVFVSNTLRMSVLLGYISYWISFVFERNFSNLNSMPSMVIYIFSKYGTILKLGRLFYLSKFIPAFNVVGLTFSACKSEFKILALLLGTFVCVFGYIMYATECLYNEQMNNMFATMYWALITLTTVGYGDMVPNSKIGHVIAAACAICGVIVIALPISVIASTFNKFYCFNSYVSSHVKLHGVANERVELKNIGKINETKKEKH